MALSTIVNGQAIELGQTRPAGLAIGVFSPHRKLIQWNIPTQGVVEMYINPQSFSVVEKKLIKDTRTKGGYVIQYWGESLPEIDISGTTGSGGIEGINVLRDIYRQEQVSFGNIIGQLNSGFLNNLLQSTISSTQNILNNPLANPIATTVNSLTNPSQFFSDVVTTVGNIANIFDAIGTAVTSDQQLVPTLAALATSVEMIYDGKVYRGFFKEFRADEKAEESGVFRYAIKFTVTRQYGQRLNSFPWNRTVNYGPASSDIVPLSFGAIPAITNSSSQVTQQSAPAPILGTSRRSLITGQ